MQVVHGKNFIGFFFFLHFLRGGGGGGICAVSLLT